MDDLFSLAGKIALVTGGSRGIGKAIAAAFAHRGAKVYIASRRADVCEATAAELSSDGAHCVSLPCDVSTVQGCSELAEQLGRHEPRLDVLVNNSGTAWLAPFETFPERGWDKVMDVNLKAPFFLTQAMLPALTAAAAPDRPSKVINIASVDGIRINPLETYSYGASKAALLFLTRRLAAQLAQHHIHVTAIAPGAFASDMNVFARDDPGRLLDFIPAGRIGNDDDLAGAAVFLASRAGDYVVGETLALDGGVAWANPDAVMG